MESRYSVRQAADKTGVKPYVLRYWEDELGLNIHRNEMGHRYYTRYDIQLFLDIKELKRKGLQLRAVKDLLPELMDKIGKNATCTRDSLSIPSENLEEFGAVLKEELEVDDEVQKVKECKELEREIHGQDKRQRGSEKIMEFQTILERLILRELSARDDEEEKCRSLDLAIRRQQMARKEAAAASEKKNIRKTKKTGL